MIHKFPYKEFNHVEVPDSNVLGVYELPDVPIAGTNIELVKSALDNPIGSESLSSLVSSDMRVVIVVDDSSRNTRTDIMLPIVLEELNKAGVPKDNIAIYIALGTHRQMSDIEIEEKYTKEVATNYRFVNHDWKDLSAYEKAGESDDGFEFKIHREVLHADFVIGVGQTIAHMIAGFGGGCKIINPGCADEETIGYMHWLSSKVEDDGLFAVRDNLVRRAIDEVGIAAGLKFIVNEVPAGSGEIAGVFAGDPIKAHRLACDFAKKVCLVEIQAKSDIVIADAYPSDLDFWQAIKGLSAAYGAVKQGGTVILVSPCPEGTSSQHSELTEIGYVAKERVCQLLEEGKLDKAVAGNLVLGRKLLDKADAILVTKGISQADTLSMGFGWAADPQEALTNAMATHGPTATVNVLYKASKMICTK